MPAPAGLLRSLEGHINTVIGVAFTPDAQTVISQDCGRASYRWDLATGVCIHATDDDEALLPVSRRHIPGVAVTGSELLLAVPDGRPLRASLFEQWRWQRFQQSGREFRVSAELVPHVE